MSEVIESEGISRHIEHSFPQGGAGMGFKSVLLDKGDEGFQPLSLMLVEDNEADALLFREMLAPENFRVTHYQRLSDALEAMTQDAFDVVILDLGLPDSQGIETLRRTAHHTSEAPVIVVLTGNEDERVALEAVREGAQDYLTKDRIDAELLARAIRYACERHNLQLELERVRQEAEATRQRDFYTALTDVAHITVGSQDPSEESLLELQAVYRQLAADMLKLSRQGKPSPHQAIRDFAKQTASLRLQARHVVQFHLVTLEALERESPEPSLDRLTNDMRLLLVEVLGNLADIYLSVYRVMQPSEHRS